MKKTASLFAVLAAALPAAAHAAPGLGTEVDSAIIDAGETEAELRNDTLRHGPDSGANALSLEVSHATSSSLRLNGRLDFEQEPGGPRKLDEIGFEAIYAIGRVAGINVAGYGEYGLVPDGPDTMELKLLLEHRAGPFDARLNLIATKVLAQSQAVRLGYSALIDHAVVGDWRLGLQAFGDLGQFNTFLPYTGHYAGLVVKTEIDALGPEIGIEAGYLFGLGKARDDAKGQLRLALDMEF